MAVALWTYIEQGHSTDPKHFIDIFNEKLYPIYAVQPDLETLPDIETVYRFVSTIFHAEKLALECIILCLAYVERILQKTGMTLHATNWRRVTLSALILASKVWEDQAVWNVDFLSIFPNISVADLNKPSGKFLNT